MIYILSDHIETGKTNALLKWSEGRKDTFGILTPRDENNYRYILDVHTTDSFKMQTDLATADTISVGRYHFLKSAFKTGNSILKKALKNNKSRYIIIDELGKLELQSDGFHEATTLAIKTTINSNALNLILIIRTSLLSQIIKKYHITDYQFITIKDLNKQLEFPIENRNKKNF
ncbi:MAG: nucleoside-triphosphatase [Gelidibacter sp.]|uniref:nucleoside-triphosphatase n=1 Tax=Gelidibacter sp. TaxID=2018083 RepID=UPI0032650A50